MKLKALSNTCCVNCSYSTSFECVIFQNSLVVVDNDWNSSGNIDLRVAWLAAGSNLMESDSQLIAVTSIMYRHIHYLI